MIRLLYAGGVSLCAQPADDLCDGIYLLVGKSAKRVYYMKLIEY